jgi:hypothetical protein
MVEMSDELKCLFLKMIDDSREFQLTNEWNKDVNSRLG